LGECKKHNDFYLFTSGGKLALSIYDILFWHYPEDGLIRIKKKSGWELVSAKEVIEH